MQVAVAVAQVPVCWSVRKNVETVLEVIGAAEVGSLVVFPEAALSGYDDDLSGLDELRPDELAGAREEVAQAAGRAGVHVVCGSLLPEDGQWYNAGIYFPPAGESFVYRKVNLAGHERGRLAAGSALPTVVMRLPGGDMRAGLQLCREIRFPEQWAALARPGADVPDLRAEPGAAAGSVARPPGQPGGRDAAVRAGGQRRRGSAALPDDDRVTAGGR
ncbi:MAG TPA: carbon-nitrogen hydrolase family protein, partial [Streptosporangiaceae bacterium]|nr:carbon-nitrogen hydrolase family protein [Streptosporangiaceae bacterium]